MTQKDSQSNWQALVALAPIARRKRRRQVVTTANSLVNENAAGKRALRKPGLAPCGLGELAEAIAQSVNPAADMRTSSTYKTHGPVESLWAEIPISRLL